MEFKTKDEVQKAFQSLLDKHLKQKKQIVTKEEQALAEKNKQLAQEATSHRPEAIVKGMAELQLELGNAVESLAGKLQSEEETLSKLKQGYKVQQEAEKLVSDTKIAANALYILKLEQAQQREQLEQAHAERMKALEERITQTREDWAKEQAEFEREETEYAANLDKNRSKELEEYKYQLERKYKIEEDQYQEKKKLLVRELEEKQRAHEKDWAQREKALTEKEEDYNKYKEKVDNFDTELENKVKEARDKAFKQSSKEAKEEIDLLEKEVEGKRQMAEFQIQSLEKNIAQQQAEIERTAAELKEALAQVQQLSLRALDASKNR